MTKDQIEQMLGEMGIPFRYHHFTQKEMQDIPLPIVVWLTPEQIIFRRWQDIQKDNETGY